MADFDRRNFIHRVGPDRRIDVAPCEDPPSGLSVRAVTPHRRTRKLGVDFVDMTAARQRQREKEPGSLQIVPGGHLNELGHELMARVLASRIRRPGIFR